MRTHTLIGANTLQSVRNKYPQNTMVNMGIAIARSHHEKWDGSGYPDGLSGEDSPLSARIMAVADVYDALRSRRPYKSPMSHEDSLKKILVGAGQYFDPMLVEALTSTADEFAHIHSRLASA